MSEPQERRSPYLPAEVVREVDAFTHLPSDHREQQGPRHHAAHLATALQDTQSWDAIQNTFQLSTPRFLDPSLRVTPLTLMHLE